ncbi:hypothetical protein K493DRAFT_312112, partial [Basidiobolus meristosporus CBS 931.73]
MSKQSAKWQCYRINPNRLIKLLCAVGLLGCILLTVWKSHEIRQSATIPYQTQASTGRGHSVDVKSLIGAFVEEDEPTEFQHIPLETLIQQYPPDTNYFLYNWLSFLGFNNVRYMIEHAYYYGNLINRTVVLPHRVHCRSCIHEGYCHIIGYPVDDSEIMDSPDGVDGKYRWSVPIEEFIDMNHLTRNSGARLIRMQDFLRLQLYYQDLASKGSANKSNLIRQWDAVDPIAYLRDHRGISFEDGSADNFKVAFPEQSYAATSEIGDVCGKENSVDDLTPILERAEKLRQNGQTKIELYKYPNEPNYSVREFQTHTVDLDAVPELVGFAQEFSTEKYPQRFLHFTARYIHFFPRRPFMFATEANRETYDHFVLHLLRYPYRVRKAAEHLYRNLERKMVTKGIYPVSTSVPTTENHQRAPLGQFIGIHSRRGDFIRYNWVGETSNLNEWKHSMVQLVDHLKSQQQLDLFYLATDETSPDAFGELYSQGMVRLYDLIDQEFASQYSHLATFGDWLALLDQEILSRSKYFVPVYMSSVSGGVLNKRKAMGLPDAPETREWMSRLLEDINLQM